MDAIGPTLQAEDRLSFPSARAEARRKPSPERDVLCSDRIDQRHRRKQQRIIGNAVEDLQFEDETVTHIGKIADRSAEVRLGILNDGGGKAGYDKARPEI